MHMVCPDCRLHGCSPDCPGPEGSAVCDECGSGAAVRNGVVQCNSCGRGYDRPPRWYPEFGE